MMLGVGYGMTSCSVRAGLAFFFLFRMTMGGRGLGWRVFGLADGGFGGPSWLCLCWWLGVFKLRSPAYGARSIFPYVLFRRSACCVPRTASELRRQRKVNPRSQAQSSQ